MVASASPSPEIDERALDARLAELRAARDKTTRAEAARTAGTAMGLGLKIGVELVVSVIVCAAIGWSIDKLAHSAPAGMIIGLFVGFGVGLRNVFRSAKTTSARWTAAIEADAAATAGKDH
jgi:ATP synthase protein I